MRSHLLSLPMLTLAQAAEQVIRAFRTPALEVFTSTQELVEGIASGEVGDILASTLRVTGIVQFPPLRSMTESVALAVAYGGMMPPLSPDFLPRTASDLTASLAREDDCCSILVQSVTLPDFWLAVSYTDVAGSPTSLLATGRVGIHPGALSVLAIPAAGTRPLALRVTCSRNPHFYCVIDVV